MNSLCMLLLCSLPACPGARPDAYTVCSAEYAGDLAFARGCEPIPGRFDAQRENPCFRPLDPAAPRPAPASSAERPGLSQWRVDSCCFLPCPPVAEPSRIADAGEAADLPRWVRCQHRIPLDKDGKCPVCPRVGGSGPQ